MTEHLPSDPCQRCGGSGRLTIFDMPMYIGQICGPIGDEPCPVCRPSDEDDEPMDDATRYALGAM